MIKKETDLTKREILIERGKRIRKRREEMKLTQEQLGEKCGWTQKRISFYESGDREADAESLLILARVLDVSASFFYPVQENKNNIYEMPLKRSIFAAVKNLPILTLQEAINLRSKQYMEKILNDPSRKFIPVPADTPNNCLAIQVADDSMINPDKASQRNFTPGETVIIDPDMQPDPTDLVIAAVDGSEKALLRQYWFNRDTQKHQLLPFNVYYPVVDIDDNVKILGVVTKKITVFK